MGVALLKDKIRATDLLLNEGLNENMDQLAKPHSVRRCAQVLKEDGHMLAKALGIERQRRKKKHKRHGRSRLKKKA